MADPDVNVKFNMSHADNRLLIALTRGREVGIDIERERLLEPLDMAQFCFSPNERAALQRLAVAERMRAFFRGWTRKESFVKATGKGFSYPLDSFDVSLDEVPENALLAYTSTDEDTKLEWTIRSVEVQDRFAAAITVQGTDWRLVILETSIRELEECLLT